MRSSLLALLCLSLLAAHVPAQGLERVAPRDEEALPDLLARDFRRDEWKAALSVSDLDRRERNLEALLQRARLDPVARAFLEELARDPGAGELAWTARLALRELGRARFAPRASLLGPDPLGTAGRMDEVLKELLGNGLPRSLGPRAGGLVLEGLGGHGVRIEQGQGFARLELQQGSGAEAETRVYEGESLDAILRANPELEKALGGLALPFGSAAPQAGANGRARIDGQTYATPLVPAPRSVPLTTDKLGVIVTPLAAEGARKLALEPGLGLEVARVLPESFAALLGVVPGDVLLELDGVALRTADDIERAMKARGKEADLALSWIDGDAQRQKKTWKAPAPR